MQTEQGLFVILIFIIYKGVSILLEIGELLKNEREKAGVSLSEAANDIHLKDVILENIESGNIGCFKDIAELKEYLTNYAKYLGLESQDILDKFNEYMFEYTSRIPMKEIEKKLTLLNKEKDVERVVSPYTKPGKKYPKKTYYLLYGVSILVIIVIIIWSILQILSSRM